jgi:hypothetical protein
MLEMLPWGTRLAGRAKPGAVAAREETSVTMTENEGVVKGKSGIEKREGENGGRCR